MYNRRGDSSSLRPDRVVEQAAGDWIARLDRGLSPEEAACFAAWKSADPRHAAEFARLNATWQALDTADEVPEIMRAVHELDRHPAGVRPWLARYSRTVAAFGAAAALAVTGAIFSGRDGTASHPAVGESLSYQVVPSTAQRLTLADGTVVELNADSAVEPAFSADERRVRLVRGEAHFKVVKDSARPFIVQVGTVAVRAVGTAFNVRKSAATVEVLVTEGKVRVDDTVMQASLLARAGATRASAAPESFVLVAGQRVVLAADTPGPVLPVVATMEDLDRVQRWQGTQLVFKRTLLGDAVAAFNRFNRCQIVLGEPGLRTRRLGGTFRADNVEAFVRLLGTGFELTVERPSDTEIVLHGAK